MGFDEELVPLLRKIGDEAELYAIANYLPDAQADAVLLLADGLEPDEVWAELVQDYDLREDGEVDRRRSSTPPWSGPAHGRHS